MLGEVPKVGFPYLERAAGTSPVNKLNLCQVVVGVVVLILLLQSVVSAKPTEIPCSLPFHIRSSTAIEFHLTCQIHREILLPRPSGSSYTPVLGFAF